MEKTLKLFNTTNMQLKDKNLLRTQAYINGLWYEAMNQQRFLVKNPANGATLAEVPDLGTLETREAINAANNALPEWSSKTATQRSIILRRWFDLIQEHADDLGMILTMEQGKPLPEARGEVRYGATFVEWFAEEAKRAYGDIIPTHQHGMRLLVMKQPVGVVGAITPWNFPNAMITRKVAPALAAGCTVVLKPSDETPLSALALAELAERAGIPPGVINIVTGLNAKEIGEELTSNPLVKKYRSPEALPSVNN